MGCGVCKSQSCLEQVWEPEAGSTPRGAAGPVKPEAENWPCIRPKLFIVSEEPSSLEESVNVVGRFESKAKLHKSLSNVSLKQLNS